MANTKGRVLIPGNPKDKLDLAEKVFEKNTADGANSELKNMDSVYDWDKVGPSIATAQALHKKA